MNERTDEQRFKIFISYARDDSKKARLIAKKCSEFGYDAFLDEERISWGENWQERIEEEIQSCDIAIVIISSHSFSSEWARKEWNVLCEEKWKRPEIKIVPVKIENTKTPPFLCRYETIWSKDYSTEGRELRECLSTSQEQKLSTSEKISGERELDQEISRAKDRIRNITENLGKNLTTDGGSGDSQA